MNSKKADIKNAIFLGTICSIAYFSVYVSLNVLGTVSPEMINSGFLTTSQIGTLSSIFFITYAVGQLINGIIGDNVKAIYMLFFGLALSGVCCYSFPLLPAVPIVTYLVYGLMGFFLSMIYAPMTKTVSENTKQIYAVRCGVGYSFAAGFGSPIAGILAVFLAWTGVFKVSGLFLIVCAVGIFFSFKYLEKTSAIKYHKVEKEKDSKPQYSVLLKHQIIKFTLVSVITGVVRTTVVFWLPTYTTQYLNFSEKSSALIFTISTLVVSVSTFFAVFFYGLLKRNMSLTLFLFFLASCLCFGLVILVPSAVINIVFLVLAIFFSHCAASILWSIYCVSLKETGLVSGATGFLDFMSYMAAAVSSKLFAGAVDSIGWNGLLVTWFIIGVFGILISVPTKRKIKTQ